MSHAAEPGFFESLSPPICDTCGCVIEEDDQQCPALDDGVCAP